MLPTDAVSTVFFLFRVCLKVTQMLLTQSKWFNNSCERRREKKIRDPGAGMGGKRKSGKRIKCQVQLNGAQAFPQIPVLYITM